MTRMVEHGEITKLRCKCGARFKKEREMRRHLTGKVESDIWLETQFLPRRVRR